MSSSPGALRRALRALCRAGRAEQQEVGVTLLPLSALAGGLPLLLGPHQHLYRAGRAHVVVLTRGKVPLPGLYPGGEAGGSAAASEHGWDPARVLTAAAARAAAK